MEIQINLEIRDESGNIKFSEPVFISDKATGKTLIETLRHELSFIMGDKAFQALVKWDSQLPKDLLSDGATVILQEKSTKNLVLYNSHKKSALKNSRLAGDSSTDAPLTGLKKKPKGQ